MVFATGWQLEDIFIAPIFISRSFRYLSLPHFFPGYDSFLKTIRHTSADSIKRCLLAFWNTPQFFLFKNGKFISVLSLLHFTNAQHTYTDFKDWMFCSAQSISLFNELICIKLYSSWAVSSQHNNYFDIHFVTKSQPSKTTLCKQSDEERLKNYQFWYEQVDFLIN